MTVENQYSAEAHGNVLVPLCVLEDAAEAIGNFVSDHGWGDSDMQAMDNLDAYIARHKTNAAANVQPKGTPSLDDIYKAWYTIGADVAGLSWSRFVELLPSHVPSQETKE